MLWLLIERVSNDICSDERILESEKIQYSIEPYGGYGLARIGLNLRFGMESYAESCRSEHGQIVRTVAYGYSLGNIDILDLSYDFEQLGLTFAVDYVAEITSCQFSIGYLKFVGIHIIDIELLFEIIAEICEAARQDGGLVAGAFQHLHHSAHTLGYQALSAKPHDG